MTQLPITINRDSRGLLGFLELPFVSRRWALTCSVNFNADRGGHALKCTSEIIVLLSGSCRLSLSNEAGILQSIDLIRLDSAILVEPLVYRTLSNFSSNCVLLHCYDRYFDPSEYIHSKEELLHYCV